MNLLNGLNGAESISKAVRCSSGKEFQTVHSVINWKDFVIVYVQVTVHRDNFRKINQLDRCINIQDLFLS